MAHLNIVATLVAKEAHKDELLALFHNIVDDTRKEKGCIAYDLNVDIKNPLKFVLIEKWESQAAIDNHNQTKHFLSFVKAIEGKSDSFVVDVVEQIY